MWDLELVPPSLWASVFSSVSNGLEPPLTQSSVYVLRLTQLLGDFVMSTTHALPEELSQAVEMGRGKNGSFTRAFCMGPALSPEETDLRREHVSIRESQPICGQPPQSQPSFPRVPRAWQPALLTPSEDGASPRISYCGEAWEFLGFKQGQSLSVAPSTPRQLDPRLYQFYNHSDREGRYLPQKDSAVPTVPGSLSCAVLPWTPALRPHALPTLPAISQKHSHCSEGTRAASSHLSGAAATFPGSFRHLCWAKFAFSIKP